MLKGDRIRETMRVIKNNEVAGERTITRAGFLALTGSWTEMNGESERDSEALMSTEN